MPKLTDLYSVNRLSTLQELQQHWKTQAHPYETCLFFSFFNHSTVSSFPLHFSLALPFLSPVCPTARKLLLQCSSHGSTPTAAQLLSAGLCPQILCLAKIFRPSESSACTMSCLQQNSVLLCKPHNPFISLSCSHIKTDISTSYFMLGYNKKNSVQ